MSVHVNLFSRLSPILGMRLYSSTASYELTLEYAIMKCLNMIGHCGGSKSLTATIHGLYMYRVHPQSRDYNYIVYGYINKL